MLEHVFNFNNVLAEKPENFLFLFQRVVFDLNCIIAYNFEMMFNNATLFHIFLGTIDQ